MDAIGCDVPLTQPKQPSYTMNLVRHAMHTLLQYKLVKGTVQEQAHDTDRSQQVQFTKAPCYREKRTSPLPPPQSMKIPRRSRSRGAYLTLCC